MLKRARGPSIFRTITFDSGRREERIVDGEKEGEQGLPGLSFHQLTKRRISIFARNYSRRLRKKTIYPSRIETKSYPIPVGSRIGADLDQTFLKKKT